MSNECVGGGLSSGGSQVDVMETATDWPGDDRSGGADQTRSGRMQIQTSEGAIAGIATTFSGRLSDRRSGLIRLQRAVSVRSACAQRAVSVRWEVSGPRAELGPTPRQPTGRRPGRLVACGQRALLL